MHDQKEKNLWEEAHDGVVGKHDEVLKTPDGHALPRPLDPVVTMEVVQRYVEADRARSRRILFWTSSFFLFVVLLLLTLFLSIGVYVLKHSKRAAEVADAAAAQTAVYSAEVVSISNRVQTLAGREKQIRSVLDNRETEIVRRNKLLRSDLERFSKWVLSNKGDDSKQVDALQARIRDLEEVLGRLEGKVAHAGKSDPAAVPEIQAGPAPVEVEGAPSRQEAGTAPDTRSGFADLQELNTNVFEQALAEMTAPEPKRPPVAESEISVVTFPNGDKYRGTFKDGLFHGWGEYSFSNGDRFEGEFAQDMKNGWGTLTYSAGDRYVGLFKNDMREGRGSLSYKNGDRYVGEFRSDVPNGKGVTLYQNGNRYAGDIVNGLKHGNGVFRFANGDVYQGEFRQDERNGRGTYLYQDGSKYIGEFRSNMRHGNGRYIYPGGEEYIGEFREGMKDGKGICVYPNGNKVHVQWKKDSLVKVLDG